MAVVAFAAIELYVSEASSHSDSANSVTINISIIGGTGAGTVDHYVPSTFTVKLGQKVTLAVLNTDDNTHGLVMQAFGVDTGKINPGITDRISFLANKTGTFTFYEPPSYCTGGYMYKCDSLQHMLGNMTVAP